MITCPYSALILRSLDGFSTSNRAMLNETIYEGCFPRLHKGWALLCLKTGLPNPSQILERALEVWHGRRKASIAKRIRGVIRRCHYSLVLLSFLDGYNVAIRILAMLVSYRIYNPKI